MTTRATFRLQAVAFVMAVISFMVSAYIGYRYIGLVHCLAEQALADQKRTSAISKATDAERQAERALLSGTGTRELTLKARQHTDEVRARHPAPPARSCR